MRRRRGSVDALDLGHHGRGLFAAPRRRAWTEQGSIPLTHHMPVFVVFHHGIYVDIFVVLARMLHVEGAPVFIRNTSPCIILHYESSRTSAPRNAARHASSTGQPTPNSTQRARGVMACRHAAAPVSRNASGGMASVACARGPMSTPSQPDVRRTVGLVERTLGVADRCGRRRKEKSSHSKLQTCSRRSHWRALQRASATLLS